MQYLQETREIVASVGYASPQPDQYPTGQTIFAMDRERQASIVQTTVERIMQLEREAKASRAKLENPGYPYGDEGWTQLWTSRQTLCELVGQMMRKRLPFTQEQVALLMRWGSSLDHLYHYLTNAVIAAVEEFRESLLAAGTDLSPPLAADLDRIITLLELYPPNQAERHLIRRLQTLLGKAPRLSLQGTDVWSRDATAYIEALPSTEQESWIALFQHCALATGGKPTGKWMKKARRLLDEIGIDAFAKCINRWFPLVDKPRPADVPSGLSHDVSPLLISDYHADLLKGLVWCCEMTPQAEILRTLTALTLSSYRKIPGTGPRLTKVGNACIHTLGAIGGLDAIGQLALLRIRVKFGTAQLMLEKALNATAEKAGLPREELEEMSVPSYGLSEVGCATFGLGEITAILKVEDSRSVEIQWLNAAGKPVKSVPAAAKKEFAEDLKEIRQAQKDIDQMLGAQSERLDQLFLAQKSWPLAIWRERYLDHPLVGVLARRLIWKFDDSEKVVQGIWNQDRIETLEGDEILLSGDHAISLWHPIESPAEVVQQWRIRIESLKVRQPFKQAHREVYLLTPAEENTRVYSNRFASHVLKQHQFNALCGQRGWKNKLRLMVDDTYPPAHRMLPSWNLRAEFWIEGVGNDYGTETNEAGVYLHVSTDQVRFYRIDAATRTAHAGGGGYLLDRGQEDHPLPLTEIPPLVLSEIMRDVDLFVGVCSVANDPTWSDGGPGGRFRDYWHDHSFGELSGTASTRREILERLVPRLKIASQCSFLDRFLVVKGKLRDYKIHLGSGNILMSPNDRYLCIVARQSVATGKQDFFLPFEGDQMLSVIISKAFLLAQDAKITDPTILQQIK